MRIVAMSDTHRKHSLMGEIPDGDVLVHAGDMTAVGRYEHLCDFAEWFGAHPHKHKIVICGNHEAGVSEDTETMKAICEPYGITVLHNEVKEIDGLFFYGEPRTPAFGSWGWLYEPHHASRQWTKLPDGVDVLIAHGPPYGYGDLGPDYDKIGNIGLAKKPYPLRHYGCPQQLTRLKEVKPRLVICGHIHYSHGIHLTDFGTTVANVSICNEQYQPVHPPTVINI